MLHRRVHSRWLRIRVTRVCLLLILTRFGLPPESAVSWQENRSEGDGGPGGGELAGEQ